jgi:hypothetical protein
MIYLKRFNENFGIDKDFSKIKEELELNCQKFLNDIKLSKSSLIWRGTENKIDDIELFNVNKNRMPRNMDSEINSMLNIYFNQYHGIELRKIGVFGTKHPQISDEYGYSYLFFPKGDYKFYWNPNITDLLTEMETDLSNYYVNRDDRYLIRRYSDEYEDLSDESEVDNWLSEKSEEAIEEFEEYVKYIVRGYKCSDDIKNTINKISDQEITFVCDQYYLVNSKYETQIIDFLS